MLDPGITVQLNQRTILMSLYGPEMQIVFGIINQHDGSQSFEIVSSTHLTSSQTKLFVTSYDLIL